MGYYTEYFSTLFKGPWATTLKERWEARRAMNNLRTADKRLYQKLPELIEREHRVTAGKEEEDRIVNSLKASAANGYSLAFNASTMDMAALEAINKLIEAWVKVHDAVRRFSGSRASKNLEAVSRLFVQLMQKALRNAQAKERDEMKEVMILVDESPEKSHEQFMQMVRLRFQKEQSQSMLAKFAIRSEIGTERRTIRAVEVIAKRCEKVLKDLEGAKGKDTQIKLESAVAELEALAKESANDVELIFSQAYMIKKRDFILMLKLIANAETLKGMNKQWLAKHFMPEASVKSTEIALDKIEQKIAHDFHTIAQALRISINGIEESERKVARAA